MLKEFKEFAMRGNVVDLAIGVIIGAAFGRIVDSLVNDIIMPFIGAIGGRGLFQLFLRPLLESRRQQPRRCEKAGSGLRLRQFHHRRGQFSHHRLRSLPRRQGDQHDEETHSRRPCGARAAERRSRSAHPNSRLARQTLIAKRSEGEPAGVASRFSGRRRSPSCGRASSRS